MAIKFGRPLESKTRVVPVEAGKASKLDLHIRPRRNRQHDWQAGPDAQRSRVGQRRPASAAPAAQTQASPSLGACLWALRARWPAA